ncbi:pentatricopeptide repeat-containing protein At2g27610-like [Actinidia eriantha]|uniref:pentatricopeptide repeat-containing protein At2g27610-like n=1 Tax=Actinidia eriantha TaxID=165200 RepID=UPI00258C1DEF|nr:pentatricopeptide repeat-containing protein At2g27610-like [Actinidia eriantha]XP_057471931.1 pentatricopeptide repeat-containing protein At2g27610-like [Actinidia eriantha]XP_057471932.1 pentatricopeptide repeat-containing protein At2g27610-like [Actinidia eriantha]XP_057471933.1 pentatricopeptide repeat-containing protein At2g27610-like [Actinidia eriantha]
MSLSNLLRLYGNTRSILRGRAIHGKLITSGSHPDVYTNNHLLSMYLKFDHIDEARKVFDKMPERNLISWTTLITWYSQMGLAEEALSCFRLMVGDGFRPNHYTYVGAISACASVGSARTGKEIHGRIYRVEEVLNSFVSNCLVNLYGKCGMLRSARLVFDAILEPNSVSLTSLLSCYCQNGEYVDGLKIFLQSQRAGVKLNEFSGASVLGTCAALENLEVGMQVHSLIVKCGVRMDQFVVTGLINLYAKCSELELAQQAFLEVNNPQLSAWTTLIGGCVQQGKGREAIGLFCKLHSAGLKPNERTFTSVLGAFADAMKIEGGKQLHSLIIKLGFCSFLMVGNAVVDFYLKSGFLKESSKTFEEMDAHDIVSWNALISGCVKSCRYEEAIELLHHMSVEGFEPNLYTYSSVLSICGDLPAIEWGRQTHCCILKPGFDSNVFVGSALIDMYTKCGRLSDARRVFDNLPSKNLVSWNTMLVGYAQHGFCREALEIYDMMQRDGVKPNDITFIGVLSACGHMGLLEEGLRYFESMTRNYDITPRTDHLACVVSLMARKGQTQGAYDFIKQFPVEPDKVVWRCLLSGCKTKNDLALGKYAAEQILNIDPDDTSAHIMLSNIYAGAKMWNETAQIRRTMKEKLLKKDPGYSWTELKNNIYSFGAGHNMDFQGYNVHEIMNGLTAQLFDAGYVPDAMFSLDNRDHAHQELST